MNLLKTNPIAVGRIECAIRVETLVCADTVAAGAAEGSMSLGASIS